MQCIGLVFTRGKHHALRTCFNKWLLAHRPFTPATPNPMNTALLSPLIVWTPRHTQCALQLTHHQLPADSVGLVAWEGPKARGHAQCVPYVNRCGWSATDLKDDAWLPKQNTGRSAGMTCAMICIYGTLHGQDQCSAGPACQATHTLTRSPAW